MLYIYFRAKLNDKSTTRESLANKKTGFFLVGVQLMLTQEK